MVTYCQSWCADCGFYIEERYPWVSHCPKCGSESLQWTNPEDDATYDEISFWDQWTDIEEKGNE